MSKKDMAVVTLFTMSALIITIFQANMMVIVDAIKLNDLSFKGPFTEISPAGDRTLGKHWSIGNKGKYNIAGYDSTVHENSVRLTSDARDRKGMIWNTRKIASDMLTVVVDFRVSGSNKRWFGNGMALWVTQHPKHIYYDNRYGFADKYVGVGVVMDSFAAGRVGSKDLHKDVTVMVNDGKSSTDDLLNDQAGLGCDAAFRYHEGKANFNSVYDTSRIKIRISSTKLTVEMDPEGSGFWTKCYDGQINLPRGWLQSATFGITASTGPTASDNHDILSVTAFNSIDDSNEEMALDVAFENKLQDKGVEKYFGDGQCGVDCKIEILKRNMDDVKVNVGHKMMDLQEKTKVSVESIKKLENLSHAKIDNLATRVQETVDGRMTYRTEAMGRNMQRKIERTARIQLKTTATDWKFPFYFLIVIAIAAFIYAYRQYTVFVAKSKFY